MRNIIILLFFILILANMQAFQVGETLIFDVKYGMIKAGKATFTIEETTYWDTVSCYQIESLAKTNSFFDKFYKVRDRMESIWRKSDLSSLRFTKKLKEGKYRQHRIHFYYPEQGFTIYTKFSRKTKKAKERRMDILPGTQDIFSAFYYYRLQDIAVGDTVTINVTADGRSYPAKIVAHRLETVDTIFGEKECIVIEPMLEGDAIFKQTGKIFIWLTNDEHKIPVLVSSKIIFGHFKAILKNAKNVAYKIIKKK